MSNKIGDKKQDSKVDLDDKLLGTEAESKETLNYTIKSLIPVIFAMIFMMLLL